MTTVSRTQTQPQGGFWKETLVGGLIGAFIGQPILGALGGFAYRLLKTDGMADSVKTLIGDFVGSDNPVASLGKTLGATDPNAAQREAPAQQQSGLPSWAKWGIGLAAAGTALNFVQDNMFSTFFGFPRFGFGLGWGAPFGGLWNPVMPFWGRGFFPYW